MEKVINEMDKGNDGMADKVAGFGRDAAATVRGAAKKAESAFTDMVESDQAQAVVHAVEGSIADAGQWLSDVQKKATATVRKYPVQAVLVGFGLGALLATLVRSPRRD